LSQVLVKRGNATSRGDMVGQMGSSGRSTGPHLHYEVRFHGKAVDPEKYLSVADLSFTVPM
ncbi:M23 family metallopeptidase, partial [Desulfobulbus sp. F4]|nr:M23 family metallopeptidase [Desulfobulbus sp. F4]